MKHILNFLKALAAMLIGAAVNGMLMAEGVAVPASGSGVTITGEKLNTDTTREVTPELLKDAVEEYVTEMNPYKTPLVSILMHAKAKTKKINDMRFKYYAIDTVANNASVTTEVAQGANSNANIVVDNTGIFNVTDTIRIVSPENEELCFAYINGIDATTNTLKVQVCYDMENEDEPKFPAVAAASTVYLLSRAASEGEVTTPEFGALPTPESNYCQIFKFQVGETTIQQLASKECKWDLTDQERYGAERWKESIEAAYLFNKCKGYFRNPVTGKYVYTTKGIIPVIEEKGKKLELPATGLKNEHFVALCRDIFVGNSGSEDRIMLAGEDFITNISKAEVQNNKDATKSEVLWGITWKVIETNFGRLLMVHHPLFGRYGYSNKAVVIDPQHIQEYELLGIERLELELKKTGQFDGKSTVITKIAGVAAKYPSCHAIVSLV